MNNVLRFPDDERDREIANAVEGVLAPPSDTPAYWTGLHQRIMARIATAGSGGAWWAVSPMTARAGLIAAGLALLALGALAIQTREHEARLAFETVTEIPLEVAGSIRGVDEPVSRGVLRTR